MNKLMARPVSDGTPSSSRYLWELPWQEKWPQELLLFASNKSNTASYLNKSMRI
jgi:hypothetical protein